MGYDLPNQQSDKKRRIRSPLLSVTVVVVVIIIYRRCLFVPSNVTLHARVFLDEPCDAFDHGRFLSIEAKRKATRMRLCS